MDSPPFRFPQRWPRATTGEVDFMNHRHMSIDVVQAILSLVLFACPLAAAEFRPVAVWTDAECYSNPPGKYAAEKMIDGDLGTYACLLDDTRTGKDTTVCPPKAAPPVTATFVLDLGAERTVSGMRFVARNAWVYVLAKNVSIFACADAQGRGANPAAGGEPGVARNVQLQLRLRGVAASARRAT